MNVTLTESGYTLGGKWRLVPVEPTYEMAILSLNGGLDYKLGVKAAPPPPAELAISGEPVAMVDAGDDGYFAEILPDRSVSVGDQLYAFPPLSVARELWIESFNQWWDAHGQYLRAGGGQYEKTFGYHAWEAAAALYIEPPPPQQSPWQPIAMAPKDGRPVWARGYDYGDTKRDMHYTWAWFDGSSWRSPLGSEGMSELQFLTEWMPLPESAP